MSNLPPGSDNDAKAPWLTLDNPPINDGFEDAARPLMKWMSENKNPHAIVIVTSTKAEIYSGETTFYTHEFIKD